MSVGTYHSGFFGTAAVNGVELSVISWSVNPTSDIVVFKNSKTGRYPYREPTYIDVSNISIAVDYDFTQNPYQSPLTIQVGTTLASVNLYMHQTAAGSLNGPFWGFTSVVVVTTPQDLQVDGKIGTSFTCAINGPFTYPV